MKETDIRKYAALMKELELTGLEITDDKQVVRLERAITQPVKPTIYAAPEIAAPTPVNTNDKDDYISIKSPIVGVFYAAPAENAEPYVKSGDTVKKGQVICIIEAMKLLNEISSEEDGIITEICVTNGQVVEYGTELFRVKR